MSIRHPRSTPMRTKAAAAWVVLGVWIAAAAPPPSDGGPTDLTELSLEELMAVKIANVSTPSRFTQAPRDAPAAVTVITAEEIKLYGYRTLAEVLQSVRGMYVTYDRSYSYVGVRGFSRPSDFNSRVLVLVDGHRVNDNIFGGALIGREFLIDADLIDRVEIVRGPTSSLYGSSAFFAVINVFTKRARDLQRGEASVEGGSWDSFKERFTCAGVAGPGVEYTLSGSLYTSEGRERLYFEEFDDPSTHDGVARDLDGERARNLYARIVAGEYTLSAAYVWREKDIPTASWETAFNDSRYDTTDAHGYVDLAWSHALDGGSELTTRAYFDDYRYSADYPGTPAIDASNLGLSRDDDVGRMAGGEAQWVQRWDAHTLTIGGEARNHLNQDQSYYYVAPRNVILDDHARSYDLGAYAQDEYALRTNLFLNAGLRWDYYDQFGGAVNPRLGLIYHPWTDGTFKLLHGTAYRAPNAFELYYAGDGSVANPDLDPETIRTYETVYEQGLPASLRLSLSAYRFDIDDLISQTGDGTYMFENVDQATSLGAEAELEWVHRSGVRARASYANQRTEDDATDTRLPNSPEHLAKLNLLAPLYRDRLYTGVETRYTSLARTLPGSAAPHADDYWIANWTLFSQRLVSGLELSATLYNVFDTDYSVPGGTGHAQSVIAQDGRSFRVKLTYRF